MKLLSLLGTVTGISVLALLLIMQKPQFIESHEALEQLHDNQIAYTIGVVTNVQKTIQTNTISLDTGLKIKCNVLNRVHENERIRVRARVDIFEKTYSLECITLEPIHDP